MFHTVLPEANDRVIVTNKSLVSYGHVGKITKIRTRSTIIPGEIDRFLYVSMMNGRKAIIKDRPGAVEIIKDSIKL